LLRLAQGRTEVACAAIRRVVNAATDRLQRAKLLPAYVDLMLATGDVQQARGACRELTEVAEIIDTETLSAMAADSRGAVELAEGDAAAALGSLRRAFEAWQQLQAPYAAACVRMRIGLACRLLGDEEAARLEFGAARAAFEQLRAAPDLARLDACERRSLSTRQRLTVRERQVLRSIAAGKTNKAIAAELSLSERTIDRHVGNILTKLEVPSRAAAVAHALRDKLL
jgi:DNA-binding CsgD family transcriptional regulator